MGRAQRAGRQAQDISGCNIFKMLLVLWAWGSMSAKSLQSIALASFQDGAATTSTKCLAKLGNWGQSPQNCHRDLQHLSDLHLPKSPECVRVSVPIAHQKHTDRTEWVEQPYLPMHRNLAFLYDNFPEQFAKTWGSTQQCQ